MASSTVTMLRPPPAAAGPPPKNVSPPPKGFAKPPPPPRAPPPPPARSPASLSKVPPPPPVKKQSSPAPPPPPPPRALQVKRSPPPAPADASKRLRHASLAIKAPVELRDVNVFIRQHQVGQGTYGSVFVGSDRLTLEVVALKRINTNQEENGFPITALREVKILKALNHKNIVRLQEIVTSKEGQNEIPKNVFMVFEYLEYDLTGILETPEIRFSQDHIKSWSQQLLAGVHYMHTNKVIHRDLKASNLLVNKDGELKIADLGLARTWNSEMKRLTHKVVTLWYRPPELLLGCMEYTPKIDMWSVGCIIAEMFRRSGFLKGSNEATQLDLIFRTVGHPTKENWPNVDKTCRLWKQFKPSAGTSLFPNRLTEALKTNLPNPKWMTDHAVALITHLLTMDPDARWSAEQALDAEYFFEMPVVKPPDQLSMNFSVKTVHEWECRKKYEQLMAARKSQPPPPPSRN
ncbi:hypothetical protein MPSEU_000843000 [Mayamaea pseudoterrestris]|nr:hypothetical protein MPSEU_000843000 [Mayamaea pseudoterrestris]